MHIFKVSLIASVAGAMALQLHAQPASPELQNKALELLRQTMAQPQPLPNQQAPISSQPAAVASPQPATTPSPQPATTVSPQPATTASSMPAAVPAGKPASPDQQQQALQLLREKMAEQAASPTPSSTNRAAAKAKPAKSSTSKAPPAANSATTAAQPGSPTRPAEIASPTAPEQPAGPKTKQQRLMDLLDLYKADKITPAEYHAQRAKILSEP
jgi:hypothetical protein